MKQKKPWTVIDILKTTTDFFAKKHIENPRLNAENLLAHVLNIERVQLYIQFERLLSELEISHYRELVQRRSAREPLQYIIGESEFMGLKFKVDKSVLIPRPETEILIEQVLELKDTLGKQQVSILDIGTGSGCIAVSLAHHWNECNLTATDISYNSLKMAMNNAELNEVSDRIHFINHDILSADSFPLSQADIIVSNPPYIGIKEMDSLDPEISEFEPITALTDNGDGTLFYEKILSLIANGFECKFIFMELSATQTYKINKIAENFRFKNVSIIPDLNNQPRVLKIEK